VSGEGGREGRGGVCPDKVPLICWSVCGAWGGLEGADQGSHFTGDSQTQVKVPSFYLYGSSHLVYLTYLLTALVSDS
jgi:hypothetical protein